MPEAFIFPMLSSSLGCQEVATEMYVENMQDCSFSNRTFLCDFLLSKGSLCSAKGPYYVLSIIKSEDFWIPGTLIRTLEEIYSTSLLYV